jgi:ribose transport system permease protein
LGRNWAILFLLLELVAFGLLGTNFFSPENLQNILVACLPVLLLGMGETFVIITGGIDLSVGFVMGFATVVCAKFMLLLQAAGLPPYLDPAGGGGLPGHRLVPGLSTGTWWRA